MAFDSDQRDSITDINITPFVDVVLVLLVIFMVTAPMMIRQGLRVQLPSAQTAQALDMKTLSLGITAQGQWLLYGQLVTEQDLREQIRQVKTESAQLQAVLSADVDARHRYVIAAIDLLRQEGVDKFAFQVRSTERSAQINQPTEPEEASELPAEQPSY